MEKQRAAFVKDAWEAINNAQSSGLSNEAIAELLRAIINDLEDTEWRLVG